MSAGPWRLKLERRLRRGLPTWVLTWLVAAGVMLCAVRVTERALRPMLAAAARYQVRSQVTAAVEQWAARDLQERGVDYSDFLTITRNEAGEITALSADMARLNLLRAELSGELDHHRARAVMEELDRQIDLALPRELVLDLAGLTFTDSSGIAVLLRAWKAMLRIRGGMKIVNTPDQAARVFRAAGLQRMLRFQ